jgi:hypothetical protein
MALEFQCFVRNCNRGTEKKRLIPEGRGLDLLISPGAARSMNYDQSCAPFVTWPWAETPLKSRQDRALLNAQFGYRRASNMSGSGVLGWLE